MRTQCLSSGAGAVLLLLASSVGAKQSVHDHLHALHNRFHSHSVAQSTADNAAEPGIHVRSALSQIAAPAPEIKKRGGKCAFPSDAGLVAITSDSENAGWAMSPDQPCTPGSYCPYACPPGQVSVQWDPDATEYTYPKSMNGGLYCDEDGNIQKPFPEKPYCESTASNIGVVNNCGSQVSFCQTVLPGNEAMLIPTAVTDFATLAVPDTSYWAGTAAHYYINPPGVDTNTACVWGTKNNPWGNWSPYVAGANVDASGETFIKLGWNPIYLEPATPFRNNKPDWGVKIDCPDGGCNGLPCAIDPSEDDVNQMVGNQATGAGGGDFCVVTVSKGATANFVVFEAGGSQSDNKKPGQFYQSSSAAPTSSSTSSSTSSEATSTLSASSSSSSSSTTTTLSSSSSSSFSSSYSSSYSSSSSSTSSSLSTSSSTTSSSSSSSSSSPKSSSTSSSPSSSSSSSSSSSQSSTSSSTSTESSTSTSAGSLTTPWTISNATAALYFLSGSQASQTGLSSLGTSPTVAATAAQNAGAGGNFTSAQNSAGSTSSSHLSSDATGGARPSIPSLLGGMAPLLVAAAMAAFTFS